MQAFFCFWNRRRRRRRRRGKTEEEDLEEEECGSLFFLKALQLQNGCDQKTIPGSFHTYVLKP
jgi:hypothetical protein